VWGTAAYFFSHKMVRLILLTAPIGSTLGGIAAGRIFAWCLRQWWEDQPTGSDDQKEGEIDSSAKVGKRKKSKKTGATSSSGSSFDGILSLQQAFHSAIKTKEGTVALRTVSAVVLILGFMIGTSFTRYCWLLRRDLSSPSIIAKARTRDGNIITVDDYREAYWWLRDNTPEDARVMAWWDYGYQISAIANRTTIADGNTWNHEHIALLGKTLTTDLDEGWSIARHLADYLLVWAGGGGDDLAKSPHLARIANSVYRDHCPDDPTCRVFGFVDREGTPSAMMGRSLLYRLHSHKLKPGVEAPADKFEEVHRSKYGKVRIFKILGVDEESKQWVKENYQCDAPGSWFCPGQYPPGLSDILSKKKDFSQLEDFNKRRQSGDDDEYTRKYFEDLHDPNKAKQKVLEKERKMKLEAAAATKDGPSRSLEEEAEYQELIKKVYNTWDDTDDTTRMWQLISSNNVIDLKAWLDVEPHKAFIRSKDGRGPMFWAFEQRNEEITKVLMKAGVPHTDRDSRGMTPGELLEGEPMRGQ
jgi:dolichyl-diphosphooligosaccharide--protein glycosyltransferase